jgi:hypothetical protein
MAINTKRGPASGALGELMHRIYDLLEHSLVLLSPKRTARWKLCVERTMTLSCCLGRIFAPKICTKTLFAVEAWQKSHIHNADAAIRGSVNSCLVQTRGFYLQRIRGDLSHASHSSQVTCCCCCCCGGGGDGAQINCDIVTTAVCRVFECLHLDQCPAHCCRCCTMRPGPVSLLCSLQMLD